MIVMDLSGACAAMTATLHGDAAAGAAAFRGVSTDSRAVQAGELFVALRGERFDGHAFVATARERGALAAVVAADAIDALRDAGLPLLAVADTRIALGELARAWRERFALPLIAVTGSNGKTTTKEMIACILRAAFGDAVLATQGNFNNDIGLPLTLLRLDASHRAAIVEMGMNHPDEIAYLARIAQPSVALVTNAQRAHLAGMGSLETIAREKGSIFGGLRADGVAVYGTDERWADLWRTQSAGHRVVDFSFERAAQVGGRYQMRGLATHVTLVLPDTSLEVELAVPGAHNARNALAAAAATYAAGVPGEAIRDGLAAFSGIKGRLQKRAGRNGATLLDDSYNANPDSVRAGIDVLAATIGQKILVLGDMGEIGDMAGQFHDEIGGYAKSQGIDRLLALGEASAVAARNFGAGGQHFKKVEALVEALGALMNETTTVLVKGSRFMRMERVVEAVTLADSGAAAVQKGDTPCC